MFHLGIIFSSGNLTFILLSFLNRFLWEHHFSHAMCCVPSILLPSLICGIAIEQNRQKATQESAGLHTSHSIKENFFFKCGQDIECLKLGTCPYKKQPLSLKAD